MKDLKIFNCIYISVSGIVLWPEQVELYDMSERNGGRPAGEGAKTPWPTLEKIKRVKSAHVAVKWEANAYAAKDDAWLRGC